MSLFFSIFFGTFILEDLALASSIALVANGDMSLTSAFTACFLGIGLGDLGLYVLGYAAARLGWADRFNFIRNLKNRVENAPSSALVASGVFVSRFVPGTRFITYVTAGFLRYSFWRFTLLTIVSVLLWVAVAFAGARSVLALAGEHWILATISFLVFFSLLKTWLPRMLDPWDRRASRHAWRKWTHFEFWPAWFFYIPIVWDYTYLSLTLRSFLLPFYANPQILNGGLIGESKWDFLKHFRDNNPNILKTLCLVHTAARDEAVQAIEAAAFTYPYILKPDVGQRGYGVRIIRGAKERDDYLAQNKSADLIVQDYSDLPFEAGIFYYRRPSETTGRIFSITDKSFPRLTADGVRPVGALILAEKRARIMAPVYFARHRFELDHVYPSGHGIQLSECGNHCQGAIFKNGSTLNTPALAARIEALAREIPDFYFGRFDIRYENPELLKQGLGFRIVEINGAGSEATHIWDPATKLTEAYRVLFQQWRILFEIGLEVKRQRRPGSRVRLFQLLKECFRVSRRQDSLSVSS